MVDLVPTASQVRLGNTIKMFSKDLKFGKRSEATRVLTVNALDLWDENKAPPQGAWMVALSTEITKPFTVNDNQVVPLKALIQPSAGSSGHSFEVDVHPSVLVPVFTPSIQVSVFWANIEQNVLPALPFNFPQEIKVRATAHQANLEGQGTVSQLQHVDPADTVRIVKVPPFVDRFAIRGTASDSPFLAGTIIQVGSGDESGGGFPLLEMNGAQMLAVVQDGRWIDLPGKAGALGVSLAAANTNPFLIEYGLRF